ncbi:MAG: DNA-processing protein DprA [Candidatus Omnitrophota bacterium]
MFFDKPVHTGSSSGLERIAFARVTSKNPKARRKTLKKHIGPAQLPQCSPVELGLLGFSESDISDIKTGYLGIAEQEMELALKNKVDIIFKEDEFYPPSLAEIYDPPDFIYALGNKDILKTQKIAIVGSRKGSPYGWWCLNEILPDLCAAGLTVVSGMAYGIDSMAHQIVLKLKGNTIGVNAGGLLHLYPPGNTGIIHAIIRNGCIITEFGLNTVPRPFYFPIRNRIIAGISRSILVVEAALKSGSLITARLGLEQNRDIFAIPGRIDSPLSQGTNYLIQQGARLITTSKDILDEYGIVSTSAKKTMDVELSLNEKQLLAFMEDGSIKTVDEFVDRFDFSVSEIISMLMGLVLKNVVMEESGGFKYIRRLL